MPLHPCLPAACCLCCAPFALLPFCSDLHPTTSLLQPFDGAEEAGLPPGVLLISSAGILLVDCSAAGHTAAAGAAGQGVVTAAGQAGHDVPVEARLLELLHWELPGLPLSCTWLPGRLLLVGDDRAGVCLCVFCCSSCWHRVPTRVVVTCIINNAAM